MTTQNRDEYKQELAQTFKQLNKAMIWMWKLGLGRFINMMPEEIGQIMVLTHIGRKSGKERQTPLNYAEIDGDIYCMAGFGSGAHWYKNVQANPMVEIWLPDGWWVGKADEVTEREDHLAILRAVLQASGFAASEFEGIDAKTITEEELAALMQENDYRLMRIQRTEERTGAGGPGEYSWVWGVVVGVLLLLLLLIIMAARSSRSK